MKMMPTEAAKLNARLRASVAEIDEIDAATEVGVAIADAASAAGVCALVRRVRSCE